MKEPKGAGSKGVATGLNPQRPTSRIALRWSRKARGRMIPPAFSDLASERQFLTEFRLAGLHSVAVACMFGIGIYLAFGALEIVYGVWTIEATVRRAIAACLLLVIAALVRFAPDKVLKAYSPLIGTFGCIAIVGIVSVIRIFRGDAASALINPVSLLAIWVLYGFGRLPIGLAILVGTIGSVFSMYGALLTNMHEPTLRTVIYLFVANGLGVLMARSVEMRERRLFLQRGVIEEAKKELQTRTALAESSSAEKTRLIAAVGHDLRQPMLSAVLHAEVLVQKLQVRDFESVGRQALSVVESVKALGDTLEHLLTAARYDAGTEPIRISSVSVSAIFARVYQFFSPQAKEKGLVLRVCAPIEDLVVRTDEQILLRAITNLVSNALKFTDPRGDGVSGVIVRSTFKGGRCRIHVADTGQGIADCHMSAIWEPFFQIGNEERDRRNGIGLGLYLVRQSILRLSSHSIEVRSTLGRGARFTITLPGEISRRSQDPIEMTVDPSLSHCAAQEKRLRGAYVLLVEDDQDVRRAIENQFDSWGVTYSSGVSAKHVLDAHRSVGKAVSGIVADFRLPGGHNGIETIRILRSNLRYAPRAVLMTAEAQLAPLLEELPENTMLLLKPFDGGTLMSALNSH